MKRWPAASKQDVIQAMIALSFALLCSSSAGLSRYDPKAIDGLLIDASGVKGFSALMEEGVAEGS